MNKNSYKWYAAGDVNAFFGLMLDNIAGLVLTVGMLSAVFGFPVDFALRYMVPGTAIGVMVGDLLYFWLAFHLSKKTGRDNVTAMPLGLDTPSTIGMVLFVLGPAFAIAKGGFLESGMAEPEAVQAAAMKAWHIGICAIVITGLIKGVLALGSNWIRKVFPRAGLLGSLAAIALVLIAFTQMPKLAVNPIVGFASLAIVLVTLIARGKLPFQIPGALGAVGIGCILFYLLAGADSLFATSFVPTGGEESSITWFPVDWLTVFNFSWASSFPDTVGYLPYIVPFAIATVIGGIDCTESAASAGDEYDTRTIIGIESVATFLAGMCGGVVQTTPYIGHPAYKAMGGRAAYTLATAVFVGGAGVIGYFSVLFQWIPEAAVLPILIFIGIEITAQSFHATPRRHYAALALACVPAMAKLIMIYVGQYLAWIGSVEGAKMPQNLQDMALHLSVLAGGFILTSLIWASALAKIIDRRFFGASVFFAIGGFFVLFGVMHSPLAGDKMFLTWDLWKENQIEIIEGGETELTVGDRMLESEFAEVEKSETAEVKLIVWFTDQQRQIVINFALSYLVVAILMFALGFVVKEKVINTDEEFEKIS